MDFLGIGALEVILILVLGFLFFGPEKLPGMAAKAGKWYRNFTRAASNFTKSLNEEIEDEKKQGKSLTDSINKELNSINSEMKSTIESSITSPEKSEKQGKNETDTNLNG